MQPIAHHLKFRKYCIDISFQRSCLSTSELLQDHRAFTVAMEVEPCTADLTLIASALAATEEDIVNSRFLLHIMFVPRLDDVSLNYATALMRLFRGSGSYCKNGGREVSYGSWKYCRCRGGYTGRRCEGNNRQ